MFFNNKKNNLKSSLNFLWLMPIVLITLILGTYTVTQRLTDIKQALYINELSIIQQIASYSGYPLYTENITQLGEIASSVSVNQSIYGAAFYKANYKLINSTKNFNPPNIDLEEILSSHPPEIKLKIGDNFLIYKPILNIPIFIEDDFVFSESNEEEVLGYIVLFISKDYLKDKQKNIVMTSILICLIGILIAIALTNRINIKIENAISTTSDSIKQLGKGNYEHKISLNDNDEMSELYTDINSLSDILKNHKALMDYNIDIAVRKSNEALQTVEEQNIELSIQKEKAETANRAKDEFLAKMSHELRTPVNAILGFANIIRKKSENTDDIERAKIIVNSSNILLSIINELLDYSKIELGEYELSENQFDLIKCIDNIYQMNYETIQNKKIDFNIDIDPNIHRYVFGDEYKLAQTLNNILSNAIKFTSQGHINFNVFLKQKFTEKQIIQFIVEDTGIGIPQDQLTTIFVPFTQLKNNLDVYNEGTGLGLSIVKKLLSLMSGAIEITSDENSGTKVYIEIPLVIFTPSVEEKLDLDITGPNKINEKDLSDLKILIAEDHDFNRLLLIDILEDCNCSTYETKNGEELLGFLPEVRPDIILLDLHMPIMNGHSTCKQIRSRKDDLKDVPIIIMTADIISPNNSQLNDIGVNDVIYKPINSDELLDKILKITKPNLVSPKVLTHTSNKKSYTDVELYEEYKRLVNIALKQHSIQDSELYETLHMIKGIATLSDDVTLTIKMKSLSKYNYVEIGQKLKELKQSVIIKLSHIDFV